MPEHPESLAATLPQGAQGDAKDSQLEAVLIVAHAGLHIHAKHRLVVLGEAVGDVKAGDLAAADEKGTVRVGQGPSNASQRPVANTTSEAPRQALVS